MRLRTFGGYVLFTGLGLASSASAVPVYPAGYQTIGVNFTGGGNGSSPAVSLLPSDSAGVLPATNYNNVAGSSGTNVALVNGAGNATTATMTFSAGGTYSSVAGAAITPQGGDEKLNTGFVYGNGTVTLSNIPYASYDVYVYELNDAAGRVETTGATQFGTPRFGSAASPADANHVDQNATTPYLYTQTISGNVNSPTPNGDYVLYHGVTGSTFTFAVSAPGNGYINGFEIVTPEPASLGLLGFAGLGLLARRRHAAL